MLATTGGSWPAWARTKGSRELVRRSERKSPAPLAAAPRVIQPPSHGPPIWAPILGSTPVPHETDGPVAARPTPTGTTYARAISGRLKARARRNARSGSRVSPRHVVGVSQPE